MAEGKVLGTNTLFLQVIDIVEVDFGVNSNPLCGSNQFVEEWPLPHDNRGTVVDLSPGDLRSAGGCATTTGFAARAGAQANHALTFKPDHSLGAGQFDHDGVPNSSV
jgi:hypothetical protein